MMDDAALHFLAYCEMQDAAVGRPWAEMVAAPGAAVLELAKLISYFETQIDDEWRALIIHIGGAALALDQNLSRGEVVS